MPYEFASAGCPAQDTDESPWEEEDGAPSATNTAHAEAEWTRLSSGFQNVRTLRPNSERPHRRLYI